MQLKQGAAFITSRKTPSDHEWEVFEATLEVSLTFEHRQTAVLGGGGNSLLKFGKQLTVIK